MLIKTIPCIMAGVLLAACGTAQRHTDGSTHSVRLSLPPAAAARCFARNAEEHSSALMSEVSTARDGAAAEVVVRVKNGVTYATAEFRRAGAGSSAAVTLMVKTSGRRSDLLDALTNGC